VRNNAVPADKEFRQIRKEASADYFI
jgi:hypothetical protein